MSDNAYQQALAELGEAIRKVHEQIKGLANAGTLARALEKREAERQLRAAGLTRTEARSEVSRMFKIDKLGDNE